MKKLFTYALLLLAFNIYAQNIFQVGNLTTKGNVTYSGLIKISSDDKIVYKADRSSETRTFNAFELEGFTITEPFKKYVSYKYKKDAFKFYAVVIEGNISLVIRDKMYYIKDETNGLSILEQKDVQIANESGYFKTRLKNYIGVLSLYSKDCPNLESTVNAVDYSRKGLSKYVVKLNECYGSEIKDYTIDKSVITLLEVGMTVGQNYSKFKLNDGVYSYETEVGDPGIGVGGFVCFSPNIRKYNFSFMVGLEYTEKNGEIEMMNPPNLTNERRTVSHNFKTLEASLSALYQPFHNQKWIISPYIGTGVMYGFNLSHNIEDSEGASLNYPDLEENFQLENNQNFSFLFKGGTFINLKNSRIFLELVGTSEYSYQQNNYFGSNFQVRFGYGINIK